MTPEERTGLIERYREGASVLRAAWETVPEPARQWRPSPDDWSAHEIIVHSADSETYAAIRIRLLAAEPEPLIVGYDQEAWVDAFGYHDLPVEPALTLVEAARASTSLVLDRLTDAQWASSGRHTESGTYTASDWLRNYAAHLHDHAAQIEANVARWQAATAGS